VFFLITFEFTIWALSIIKLKINKFMTILKDNIKENPYIRESVRTNGVFKNAYCVHSLINELSTDKKFIMGIMKYPIWSSESDFFQFFTKGAIQRIQNKEVFFIFDASQEGYNMLDNNIPMYDIIHNNCEKYNIDPRMVLLITSNRKENENYEYYSKTNNIKYKINVFCENFVEKLDTQNISVNGKLFNQKIFQQLSSVEQFDFAEYMSNVQHKDKFFASLCRRPRPHRTLASFLLSQKSFSHRGLISQPYVQENIVLSLIRRSKLDYDIDTIKEWCDNLPLVVDYDNFDDNSDNAWHHAQIPYRHIHDQTIFFIVNETVQHCRDNRTLLLSEKTTRPIVNFQPFIVYGIEGIHQHMKNWGYELYEEIFDYSFDSEPCPTKRYQMILDEVKKLCKFLETLDKTERVSWKFKHKEKLIHNFENVSKNAKKRIEKFNSFIHNLPNP